MTGLPPLSVAVDGYRTRLVFDGRYASPVEGTATVTINFSPDLLDRPIEISDGSGGVLTSYTYNADGTAGTRTDPTGTATFGYDFPGRPASVSETSLTPRWSWRSSVPRRFARRGDAGHLRRGHGFQRLLVFEGPNSCDLGTALTRRRGVEIGAGDARPSSSA